MAELPFMPLSVEAWDAGTAHLTDAEDGLYGRLVRALWQMPSQRFPNDDAWLARRFRRTIDQVRTEVRPLFEEFFQTDGNWITHKRVTKEFRRAAKATKQRSEAAKARWKKEKSSYVRNAEKQNPAVILTPTPTPTPTPTNTPTYADATVGVARPPPKPRVVKFPIPPDWQPSPETVATLKAKGYSDHEIAWQRDRFVAHFLDSGERRAGWDRSFHNWVTRDPPGRHAGSSAPGYANGRPKGGRFTDGSITGAVAFLTRAGAPDFDDD